MAVEISGLDVSFGCEQGPKSSSVASRSSLDQLGTVVSAFFSRQQSGTSSWIKKRRYTDSAFRIHYMNEGVFRITDENQRLSMVYERKHGRTPRDGA